MARNADEEQLSPGETGRSGSQASKKWRIRSCQEMPMLVWNFFTNRIFIISSVIGVSVDPLFFYVPFIDEENKCIGVDKKLMIAVLILRSLTDCTTMVDIILRICKTCKPQQSESTQRISNEVKKFSKYFEFPILIVNVLPIPQVLVLVLFFRMRGNRYFEDRMVMNVLLLLQYIPRMSQIYLLSKKLTKQVHIWVKGVFYLFMYILASHIFGAFFYFFSIQRVTSCWHEKCRNTGGCTSTYRCGDRTSTSVNITLLTELCPINPTNATMFDFGIFGDGLQIGNLGSISFSQKVFYYVWWGLRNLSNFGTNLETSSFVWENCFAILISVLGLLLFLYLIGNVQQCMQWEAEKDEVLEMIKNKKKKIEFWMSDRSVPDNIKTEIRANIDRILEENKGADLDDLFSILPENMNTSLKSSLCMNMLKNVVSRLQGQSDSDQEKGQSDSDQEKGQSDDKVLEDICDNLVPVIYEAGSFFVKMGEPHDRLILITDGIMLVYTSTSTTDSSPPSIHGFVENGGVYGDKLLCSWVLSDSNMHPSFKNLPISDVNVKCMTKVNGFALTADKWRTTVSLYKNILQRSKQILAVEIEVPVAHSSIPTEEKSAINLQ